ncbi:hypothetical protein [Spiribacter sp. SSL99]|jgi:hypothetical protein|uniref:hypothetical protein n=2 Tax=Spiribacter TaxID=1335745 RepID=UPI00132FFA61|nr:hypothetical protein [Spiribacter sp. SSL99]
MRWLSDPNGIQWSVDVLFGSYGTYYLMFSPGPGEHSGQPRKLAIAADSQREAAAALDAMDEAALVAALADSTDFNETSPLGF